MRTNAPAKILTMMCVLAALAVPAGAAPRAASPPPPAPAQERSLELELTEVASGKALAPVRIVVPLVVDASPSETRVRSAATFYHLVANARRDRSGAVVVDLRLDRRDESDRSPNDFELKWSSVPTLGKRAVLGSVERADGTKFELAMTLR